MIKRVIADQKLIGLCCPWVEQTIGGWAVEANHCRSTLGIVSVTARTTMKSIMIASCRVVKLLIQLHLLTLVPECIAFSTDATAKQNPMVSIGIDLGTSGARICAIADDEVTKQPKELFSSAMSWKNGAYDDPDLWVSTARELLQRLQDAQVVTTSSRATLCVSGTSASCLVVDTSTDNNAVSRSPYMYNANVLASTPLPIQQKLQKLLDTYVPPQHTTRSGTSSLAKLLAWHLTSPIRPTERLLHQADYVAWKLGSGTSTNISTSDWHNCLKLGYDVRNLKWPSWMYELADAIGLSHTVWPARVLSPGQVMVEDGSSWNMAAGTTDSNAAFVAGCRTVQAGNAVTSLGSTLALKQLSQAYVEDADRGVYSHRFPQVLLPTTGGGDDELWLVGGASNVGCAILRALEFSNDELDHLSSTRIDPTMESPLAYYPLTQPGERFPVADSSKQPVLEPVPEDRAEFLHGVLQGISDVERDGYVALEQLGATPKCSKVWTCGGGSRNEMWTKMRERRLRTEFAELKVERAENVEASYGAALLARSGALHWSLSSIGEEK